MLRTTRLTTLCAAAAALAATAAPAVAAPSAVEPEELARAERIDDAVPFASPTGEHFVAWQVEAGAERPTNVRVRDGGAFGPVEQLSLDFSVELPDIVFDSKGNALAVLANYHTGARSLIRPARGTFGADRPAGGCGADVDVAVGPDDRIVTACSARVASDASYPNIHGFLFGDRQPFTQQIATLNVPGAGIADPHIQPRAAYGADGTTAFAVRQKPDGKSEELRVRVYAPSGQGSGSKLLMTRPEEGDVGLVALDVLPDGTTAVVANSDLGPKLFTRAPGGEFVATDLPGTYARGADADAAGTVHVLLETRAGAQRAFATVTRPLGGALGAPVEVVPPGPQSASQLAVTPDGGEHVLLERTDGVHVAGRRAGQPAFAAPVKVAGDDARWPSMAATRDGDVLVGWTREAGEDDERALLGGVDSGAAPALADVAAPSTLPAGHAGRFRGAARDAMGLRSVRWDFGDGTGADGAEAEHAYAAPGTYTATLTAVDRAGNRTTATRTVVVEGPRTLVKEVPGPATTTPAPGGGAARSVTAADRVGPALRLTVPARIARGGLRKGLRLRVAGDEPATVTATLTAGARRVARGEVDVVRGTRTLTLKGRALGRKVRALKLTVVATDAAGNRRTVTRTVKVAG